jgi:hypothetical protein
VKALLPFRQTPRSISAGSIQQQFPGRAAARLYKNNINPCSP